MLECYMKHLSIVLYVIVAVIIIVIALKFMFIKKMYF